MPVTLSLEELRGWIRLSLEPGLGPAQARNLLAAIGLPQQIYDLSAGSLGKFVPTDLARQLARAPTEELQAAIARVLDWLPQPGHHLLTLADPARSEEHTSELQSLTRISYAVFCLKKKK